MLQKFSAVSAVGYRMQFSSEQLEEAILASLQGDPKRPSALLADLSPRFSSRQIENGLSKLLDQGVVSIGTDRCLTALTVVAA